MLGKNETHKYLVIFEVETIKKVEMKEKKNSQENEVTLRNLIKGINASAVTLVRYSEPFLKR